MLWELLFDDEESKAGMLSYMENFGLKITQFYGIFEYILSIAAYKETVFCVCFASCNIVESVST
jgi:hypothetical protein